MELISDKQQERTIMSTYAVKVNNGRAEIYDANTGAYKRSFGSDVVSAQVSGDTVQVTRKNGRVEIYDAKTGAYKRSF
jgi:hypothetical protein